MKGYINNILLNDYGQEHGFITGEDGCSYSFDNRSLVGAYAMHDCKIEDEVEFTVLPPFSGQRYGRANNVSLLALEANARNAIQYYAKGFARHLDRKVAYQQHLKEGSNEDVVLDKLRQVLYISKIGHHAVDQNIKYPFCLIGATELLKQFIRGKYEFLLVFSHFDNTDWQQKTLLAERYIRKRREIEDRRPLINFYVLVSNAQNLKTEIDKTKGSTNAAIIPFSFNELLACKNQKELSDLVVSRFGEYLFENNMLGETSAIDDDSLLFGDRGKIADAIVHRCHQLSNSGIFGLRRSGKTSVLNATLRRLGRDSVKYLKIESRSDLENLDSWKTALYDIARKIREVTLGISQLPDETRSEFTSRLRLNSTEDDYDKRPSQYFVEDIKLYCKNESVFVIAIDEVELITYNTAKSEAWKSVEAYCGFWGAIRDCGCALIVCGVNSTINETNTITYNGAHGDNPMYGRIISCADFSSTYLPSFTDEQTKNMINTLGEFSNISFSDVYFEINRDFGGQPYPIRQFCAYVFETIKGLRKPNEVYEVSKATVSNLLSDFSNSVSGVGLCEIILQHLNIYPTEYEMLRRLALSPDQHKIVTGGDFPKIDHLQKYGLIDYDYSTNYVAFKIYIIKNHICKTDKKDPLDMTNDERRRYVQDCVAECEKKLKTYIRNYYVLTNQESICRRIFVRYMSSTGKHKPITINSKFSKSIDPTTCDFNDFFDHKKFIVYFSSLKAIIKDNWQNLGPKFNSLGIDKNRFSICMDDLNAGRNDADHYDAEDTSVYPEKWEIDNVTLQKFTTAISTLQKFFTACNL